MSQLSCFLEMLVQERSSVTGCLFMMPVRAWGVTVRLMLRSIRDQSRLSKHLQTRPPSYRCTSSGNWMKANSSRNMSGPKWKWNTLTICTSFCRRPCRRRDLLGLNSGRRRPTLPSRRLARPRRCPCLPHSLLPVGQTGGRGGDRAQKLMNWSPCCPV